MPSVSQTNDIPAPQANSIVAVACVVDAVANGCNTNSTIAEALGYSSRQGAYYANAAAGLGYIESCGSTNLREWELTPSGVEFMSLDAAGRVRSLTDALCDDEWLASYMRNDKTLREALAADGCDGETLERRFLSVEAWARFVFATDVAVQIAEVSASMSTTQHRAPVVSAAKKAKSIKASALPRRYCGTCNTAIPIARKSCELCE